MAKEDSVCTLQTARKSMVFLGLGLRPRENQLIAGDSVCAAKTVRVGERALFSMMRPSGERARWILL